MSRYRREETESHWHRAAVQNAEDASKWEQRYYDEHQRIVDLALEHSPELRASNEDDLPGFGKTISLFDDKQPEFTCRAKHCCFFWPCPTYRWATGTAEFVVKIELKNPPEES